MIEVLDLFFDISLAVASAVATGSIFALLIGQIAVAHKPIVRHWRENRPASAGRTPLRRARPREDMRAHRSHQPIQPTP